MWFFGLGKKRTKKIVYSNNKDYNDQVKAILEIIPQFAKLEDKQLQAKTDEFRQRLAKGSSLDDILVEAFALVCVGSARILKLKPYPVQIYGAIVLHHGDVAEMKTGEGKTLTSTMSAYLNGLQGKGVHIVTVNDYLAKRDAQEMGALFLWLGLSVGFNHAQLQPISKRLAYDADITYTTHSELGFDYLRDNMCTRLEDRVQKGLNFAIIDECDSILIDDARTPLIISGQEKNKKNLYQVANSFVSFLEKTDFQIDLESQSISLTKLGTAKAERQFQIDNLFDVSHTVLLHHIQQALKAWHVLANQKDYIVAVNKIALIDQNTGRIMEGRSYSDGLHQALEAKENLPLSQESKIVATITYQNIFRLYNKLSGMTGTAATEEEEFLEIYNMRVESIPTNRPVIRVDANDYIFGKKEIMHQNLLEEVMALHQKGQPVLIGTRTVETSEHLSQLLKAKKLQHVVLNAKNHDKESLIIQNAGQQKQITIATNMAGRGSDIKLGEKVVQLGGLAVIGCERHESRRIDNQLIGRSGRQGDPGYSRFYISWEDELLVRFVGDKVKTQAKNMGDTKLQSGLFSKMIFSAQKRIEGFNFDARKQLVEYDDVIRKQREAVYKQRDQLLAAENVFPVIETMYNHVAKVSASKFVKWVDKEKEVDSKGLIAYLEHKGLITPGALDQKLLQAAKYETAITYLKTALLKVYNVQKENLGSVIFDQAKRDVLLQIIDHYWQNHIDTMSKLRSGIHLRSYAQKNPLQAYVKEGYYLFEDMKSAISYQIVYAIKSLKLNPEKGQPDA